LWYALLMALIPVSPSQRVDGMGGFFHGNDSLQTPWPENRASVAHRFTVNRRDCERYPNQAREMALVRVVVAPRTKSSSSRICLDVHKSTDTVASPYLLFYGTCTR
jgi:hypothetical protein